jgi:hypothetical protein
VNYIHRIQAVTTVAWYMYGTRRGVIAPVLAAIYKSYSPKH